MDPSSTARFGGNLLWLATLSILAQVIYNIESGGYTLYTGEPIFTGKFRTLPGPHFWVLVYLILDSVRFFRTWRPTRPRRWRPSSWGGFPIPTTATHRWTSSGASMVFTHRRISAACRM